MKVAAQPAPAARNTASALANPGTKPGAQPHPRPAKPTGASPQRSETSAASGRYHPAAHSKERLAEDDASQFAELLGLAGGADPQPLAPLMPGHGQPEMPVATPQPQTTAEASAPPPVWHSAELQLAQTLRQPGQHPDNFTLFLPQLGPVEASLKALVGGGWNIALAFTPQAWPLVKGTQLLCGDSLTQRLGEPVLLRFIRQGLL